MNQAKAYVTLPFEKQREELGIIVRPENLKFATVYDAPEEGCLKFFFVATEWQGQPRIMEPEKCSELLWARLETLPTNTIPYLPKVLDNIWCEKYYGCTR